MPPPKVQAKFIEPMLLLRKESLPEGDDLKCPENRLVKAKPENVFGQSHRRRKMFRTGLYAVFRIGISRLW